MVESNLTLLTLPAKALKRLLLKHHPDKGGDPATFQRVYECYKNAEKEEESDKWAKDTNKSKRRSSPFDVNKASRNPFSKNEQTSMNSPDVYRKFSEKVREDKQFFQRYFEKPTKADQRIDFDLLQKQAENLRARAHRRSTQENAAKAEIKKKREQEAAKKRQTPNFDAAPKFDNRFSAPKFENRAGGERQTKPKMPPNMDKVPSAFSSDGVSSKETPRATPRVPGNGKGAANPGDKKGKGRGSVSSKPVDASNIYDSMDPTPAKNTTQETSKRRNSGLSKALPRAGSTAVPTYVKEKVKKTENFQRDRFNQLKSMYQRNSPEKRYSASDMPKKRDGIPDSNIPRRKTSSISSAQEGIDLDEEFNLDELDLDNLAPDSARKYSNISWSDEQDIDGMLFEHFANVNHSSSDNGSPDLIAESDNDTFGYKSYGYGEDDMPHDNSSTVLEGNDSNYTAYQAAPSSSFTRAKNNQRSSSEWLNVKQKWLEQEVLMHDIKRKQLDAQFQQKQEENLLSKLEEKEKQLKSFQDDLVNDLEKIRGIVA